LTDWEGGLSMAAAPEIETARLRLRAHRVDDWRSALAMWSDANVVRYIGGVPSTEQQTWSRILNYAGHWALLGFGYWAVEEKASGEFIGELGFANFKRDIEPAMRNIPELGWALVPAVHGKGYATEGVRAALVWGDAKRAFERTVCMIDVDNGASICVAEKCGYREFRRAEFSGRPTAFYEREAPRA
jgi:RimJ/RimL family protein N-acetyltransferase